MDRLTVTTTITILQFKNRLHLRSPAKFKGSNKYAINLFMFVNNTMI